VITQPERFTAPAARRGGGLWQITLERRRAAVSRISVSRRWASRLSLPAPDRYWTF
jgi:hypothetical protein